MLHVVHPSRRVSHYRFSGRSSVALIAAINTPAILSSSILARTRSQPAPGEIERESKYDPIKGNQQFVQSGCTELEPIDQGDRQQGHAPDDDQLPRSTTVDQIISPRRLPGRVQHPSA